MVQTSVFDQQDVKVEFYRRGSQTANMLKQFKLKGVLTTSDLQRLGTGCSSRLKELRNEGHLIVSQYIKPGLYSYTYKGKSGEFDDGLPDNWDEIKADASDDTSVSVID